RPVKRGAGQGPNQTFIGIGCCCACWRKPHAPLFPAQEHRMSDESRPPPIPAVRQPTIVERLIDYGRERHGHAEFDRASNKVVEAFRAIAVATLTDRSKELDARPARPVLSHRAR